MSAPTKSTTDYSVVDHDSDDDDDDYDAVSITQVTVGAANKRSALAKLESDYETILSPTGWLTCDIIQQAQVQEENSSIEGFQRPTLGPARNFNVVSGEFVQILHTGSDHWVCVVL